MVPREAFEGPGRTPMNFDYSDDQKFLKDEARKFLAANCTMQTVRGVLDNADRSYDEGLWKKGQASRADY